MSNDIFGESLGEFIREKRQRAELSLRKLAELADVSSVYLSQIEGGLRRPSADIMQKIAKGLQLSAETLYVRAGLLAEERSGSTDAVIMSDPRLSDAQRNALLTILRSFLADNAPDGSSGAANR